MTEWNACLSTLLPATTPTLFLIWGLSLQKQKKPSIKVFNGSAIKFVAFKASINGLRSKGLYDEDKLLDIVLDHVGGEAEKAIHGILPASGQFKRAMEILEQRFGNDRVIVNATWQH